MAGVSLATLVVAGLASFFMAWAIGAGSSGSTPFAPAVGANAISIMRAGFLVGLLGLAGAVLQGGNLYTLHYETGEAVASLGNVLGGKAYRNLMKQFDLLPRG